MTFLIVFIVIVVVLGVLIVLLNLRLLKRMDAPALPAEDNLKNQEGAAQSAAQTTRSGEPATGKRTTTPGVQTASRAERTDMPEPTKARVTNAQMDSSDRDWTNSDQMYREALRKGLTTTQQQVESERESPPIYGDAEYRETLRRLHQRRSDDGER